MKIIDNSNHFLKLRLVYSELRVNIHTHDPTLLRVVIEAPHCGTFAPPIGAIYQLTDSNGYVLCIQKDGGVNGLHHKAIPELHHIDEISQIAIAKVIEIRRKAEIEGYIVLLETVNEWSGE